MAHTADACPHCFGSTRRLSRLAVKEGLQKVQQAVINTVHLLGLGLCIVLGLYFAYFFSPLLMLFPLLLICAKPPASRGGKTVARGRRRQKP